MDRDLEAELQAWVALAADEEAAGRAVGPAEARRRVLAEAGGLEQIKEGVRGSRSTAFVDTLVRDIRIGLRQMLRNPGVTTAAVVAMALGVGATVATVSVVDAVLVRPLAYEDPAALVVVMHERDKPISPANFLDWQRLTRSFSAMAAAEYWTPNIGGDSPEKVFALRVTPELFPLLGIEPAQGRVLSRDQPGAREVVIGSGFWRRRFGGDPAVIGQELRLDGALYQIVGVMPPGFSFAPFWATRAEIWGAMDLTPRAGSRDGNSLRAFARLAPAVSLAQAQSDVEAVTAGLEREFPGTNRDVRVTPLRDMVTGDVRLSILVILAAVILVLLIACANVANLLLARSAARSTEMAVRLSIGAKRRSLVAQLLTESVLLAAFGGLAGVLVASWTLGGIVSMMPPEIMEGMRFDLDLRVLLFAAALSVGTGLLFGLFPALHSSRQDLLATIKGTSGQPSGSRSASWFRSGLATFQIMASMMLLATAGLFVKSLLNVSQVDLGLSVDDVVTFRLSPQRSGYSGEQTRALYDRLTEELDAQPGVTGVTAALVPLIGGSSWGSNVAVEGFDAGPDTDTNSRYNEIAPDYFRALGMTMLAGREFEMADRIGSSGVVIVNEAFAEKFNLGRNPVGRRMTVGSAGPFDLEIVGLVQNAKYNEVKGEVPPVFFRPYRQRPQVASLNFYVKSAAGLDAALASIRPVIERLDPNLPIEDLRTMPKQIEQSVFQDRIVSTLSAAFAALATVLASVGLYGVLAYTVSQRTREFGLRMALGAEPRRLRGLVMRRVGWMTLIGGALGLAAAVAIGRTVQSELYAMEGVDLSVLSTAAAILILVSLVAGFIPAYRASRVDPMTALRYE